MPRIEFERTADSAVRFVKKLGRCIGWGCFSKKAGTEYDDLHGDHFPDDELFAAVGGLMKTDFTQREIDIEHLGAAQGSIVTAWAMTEDVAKSLGVDTAGNYGVLVDFEPSADLLKSIESGEMFALSMFGTAVAEPVAKSGATVDVAAAKRKRVMRDVKLTKWAVCKAPAHEGAGVTLVKSQPSDDVLEAIAKAAPTARRAFVHFTAPLAKRAPAATSIVDGHQHSIHDAEEMDGYTSWETAEGASYGHSHSWLRDTDGTITVLVADGHTHTISMEIAAMSTPADLAKAQTDLSTARGEIAKASTRIGALSAALLVACSMPPEQAAYASRLSETERETFLAKSATERAELAKPVHVSKATGEAFYATDDQRLVKMAKRADEDAERVAKAEAERDAERFEKRADAELKHLPGTSAERGAVLKAVEGIPDESARKRAGEILKAADAAMAGKFQPPGIGGDPTRIAAGAGPEAELNALALDIQKAAEQRGAPCSFEKAYVDALDSKRGGELYAEIEAASRPPGN